jgi:hypothetical protein
MAIISSRPQDIQITTSETKIGPLMIDLIKDINIYLTNKGSQEIFVEILGSPSGISENDTDGSGNNISANDESRETYQIIVENIPSNSKKIVDIDRAYKFLIMKAWTISGESTLNYFMQDRSNEK